MTSRRVARGGLAAVAAAVLASCGRPAQPADPPRDPAAPFLGEIYVFASNQPPGRGQMMLRVDRPDRPAAPLEVRMMYGPGGTPQSAVVDGDSLVVVWGGRAGVTDYRFVLRRTRGDSVAGTWAGPEGRGTLQGRYAPM